MKCNEMHLNKVTHTNNQGQLGLSEHAWWDFVVWTPKYFVDRLAFDEKLWQLYAQSCRILFQIHD